MKSTVAPVEMSWALYDHKRGAFLGRDGALTKAAAEVQLFPSHAAVPDRSGMEAVPVDVRFDGHGHLMAVELCECEI